jgi:hypothetical protein
VRKSTDLLLKLQDGDLELGLDLGVLGLNTLQTVNAAADSWGQGLDVSRGLADKRAELVLGQREQSRVLQY